MMTSVMVMTTPGKRKPAKSMSPKSKFSLQYWYNFKEKGNRNKENNQLRNSSEHTCSIDLKLRCRELTFRGWHERKKQATKKNLKMKRKTDVFGNLASYYTVIGTPSPSPSACVVIRWIRSSTPKKKAQHYHHTHPTWRLEVGVNTITVCFIKRDVSFANCGTHNML